MAAVVAVFVAVVVAAGGPAAAAGPLPAGSLRAVSLPDMGRERSLVVHHLADPRVWAAGARGQGVTVAVIDSGVQATRPNCGEWCCPAPTSTAVGTGGPTRASR